MTDIAKSYAVMCIRHDGSERLYMRYATLDQAAGVAAVLRKVGCPSRVKDPDELPLDDMKVVGE